MRNFIKTIKADYNVFRIVHPKNAAIINILYLPSFKIVFIFRLSQLFGRYYILKPFSYLLTIFNDFLHGVWIGSSVKVGPGFFLGHPRGLVVNPRTVIGENCSIIQQVTIGGPRIIIGDNVSINAGSKIISDENKEEFVEIGDNCIIGAAALVLKSMPANSVIGGMPAKILKTIDPNDNWIYRKKLAKGLLKSE